MFPSLTVHEHLLAVARPGWWTPPRIYELFPGLARRRDNLGDQLSGSEQQIHRARAGVAPPVRRPRS